MNIFGRIKQSLVPRTRSAVNSSIPVSRPRRLRVEQLESRQLLSVAPPVVFDLDGRLYEGYYGQNTVATFRDTGAEFSWDHTHTRNSGWTGLASTTGTASIGSFKGVWVDSFDWVSTFLGAPGIGLTTTLSVYVRGGPGTPYYLDVTRQGNLLASDSGQTSGRQGNTVYVIWDGTEIAASRQTISQPINARDYAPTGITSGPTYQFPEYPGVVFSRVYYRGHQAHIWSNQGAGSGSRAHGEVNVQVDARAYIRLGQPPEANIDRVPVLVPDQEVTLTSLSYDPDNGTTPGSGILAYKWTITGPEGFSAESSDAHVPIAFSLPGQYQITLHVFDDEGMTGEATTSLEVIAPRLAVEPSSIDFGTVSWSNPVEKTIRVRNNGHPLTRLDVTLSFSGSPAFSLNDVSRETIVGGDSVELRLRLAPISPLTGPIEGHVTVTPLDAFNAPVVVELNGDVASPIPELIQTTKGPPFYKDGAQLIALHAVHHIVSSTGNASDLRGIKFREQVTFPDDVLWFFDLPLSGNNPKEWSGYPYVNFVRGPEGRWEVVIDDKNGVYDAHFWRSDWNAIIPRGISYLTVQQFEWWSPWTNAWQPLAGGAFLIDRTLIPPSVTGDTWTAVISKGGVSEIYGLAGPLAYPAHWVPAPETASSPLVGTGRQTLSEFVGKPDSSTSEEQRVAPAVALSPIARPIRVWQSLAVRLLQRRLQGLAANGTQERIGEEKISLTRKTSRELHRHMPPICNDLSEVRE